MEPFGYQCHSCGEYHSGMPCFDFEFPAEYLAIPEDDRVERTEISSDACVIDEQWFYIRAQLELPVLGYDEVFTWGVWVSISRESFKKFLETYEAAGREQNPPFFAWLTVVPYPYPPALLKTYVHLRPYPSRPFLELEPTDHPLSVAQREGLSHEKAQEIAQELLHP